MVLGNIFMVWIAVLWIFAFPVGRKRGEKERRERGERGQREKRDPLSHFVL